MGTLRWTEQQYRECRQRQGRAEANQEARAHQKDSPRPKYRNKKTAIAGRTFDSKGEAAHFVELSRMQEAGLISDLRCQVPFVLEANGHLICKYVADFTYREAASGQCVVADFKGVRTREYQIKKKLMRALLGIEIREVRKTRKRL